MMIPYQLAPLVSSYYITSDEVSIIYLRPDLFDAGFALYQQYQDKGWGLVDCISFVVMRQNEVTAALAFDQHFVQAGFQALMRG